ncbi:ATP-dependent nuclease [Streptococcus sanguinis]|uniref:Uncharacterized conserved protein n=1 Tax=Streptococcus sanguinis TaxID=1305 RepID=A0A2X3Y143_STRSA|nr:AAA family ATPase [Streptococcus sanguinis]SQF70730.1 Uncharacterized conserved protein [Streptococcus sanguinis]
MKLHKIIIQGYKRHKKTELLFSDATFLIGENNVGKSSVLEAVELLLTDSKKIEESLFYLDESGNRVDRIVLEAEFRELGEEAKSWRGFKGRLFSYEEDTNTKYRFFYKKTFSKDGSRKVEAKSLEKKLKSEFVSLKTIAEFIDKGFDESKLEKPFDDIKKKLNKKQLADFFDIYESDFDFYDYGDNEVWVENPGGIAGNVLAKLPKILFIPAYDNREDLGENRGALQSILYELFTEVRNSSAHYKEAQKHLDLLSKEMNAQKSETSFGKMMTELNATMDSVFSGVSMKATTILSDPDKTIKPTFNVTMLSNIETSVEHQGTGVIRSAVFALLKYKAERDLRKVNQERNLIICFEEPEIYLHPNAANQMRDTIYDLAYSGSNQIICTTHSPYMIDLSRKAGQVLNYLSFDSSEDDLPIIKNNPFNHKEAFKKLHEEDKVYVKLLLKMDDYLSRIFFAKNVLIIEGDTEEIVLRETILATPDELKKKIKNDWQIIRARGKPVIISVIKYMRAMGIIPYVMHDKDSGTTGAVKFNQPIREALECDSKLFVLEECIEEVLGYEAPSADKPYNAFKYIQDNWITEDRYDYDKISEKWRNTFEKIFKD